MKYRSKKNVTIDIPDGLTAQQIAAIKKDADSGYGTRAQQTANELGKKLQAKPAAPATPESPAAPAQPANTGLNAKQQIRLTWLLKNRPKDPQVAQLQAIQNGAPNTGEGGGEDTSGGIQAALNPDGTVNAGVAADTLGDTARQDLTTNIRNDNPEETDQYGNVLSYTYDDKGNIIGRKVTQGGIAKYFTDMATAAANGYNPDQERQKATDATYSTLTKYYDRDKAKELEDQKQELAMRGIPYDPAAANDPNTKNLYGRTIGAIDQKYQAYKDDATNRAFLAGEESFKNTSNARNAAIGAATGAASYFGGNYGNYSNDNNISLADQEKDLLTLGAQQYATKYGVDAQKAIADKNDLTNRLQIKTQKLIADQSNATSANNARLAASSKGSGSSGSGGFEILG